MDANSDKNSEVVACHAHGSAPVCASGNGCHAHGSAWACEQPRGNVPAANRPRRGFTLVELIMTMAIMAILSAMIAVALAGAEESAKVSHTRALIARLHTLLMDRYESYRWRRLPISSTSETTGNSPSVAAKARCNAMRNLMRIELPDRWTDVDSNDPPAVLQSPTIAYIQYQNAYNAAVKANGTALDTTYQGADCLYMIVTIGLEENDVLENFSQSDIGSDPNNPNAGLRCLSTHGETQSNSCAGHLASIRPCNRKTQPRVRLYIQPLRTKLIQPAFTALQRAPRRHLHFIR